MITRNPIHPAEPQIENPKRLPLTAEVDAILKRMFATHRRVVIKAQLGSGLSGSWVLAVHPIKDAPQLPAVIKMADVALIEKEYQAYQQHIRNRLSGAAEIRSEPVFVPESDIGGLRYHLVGSGIFEIESLNRFCRYASVEEIRDALVRLIRRMAALWRFSHSVPQFNLRDSYDRLLPINLLIEPIRPPPGAQIHVLKPDAPADQSLQRGDYVRVEGFQITEIDPLQQAITLNVPILANQSNDPTILPSTNLPLNHIPPSYRLRLQPVEMPKTYAVNQVLDAIEGMVTATRHDLLQNQIAKIQLDRDLKEPRLELPNPLRALPNTLTESRDVKAARIHGDLNLENILVDPETRDIRLIDFAMSRWDHVLHDLLRLETGVVTWLLPEALVRAKLPPETIHGLYERLHRASPQLKSLVIPQQLHPALRKSVEMLGIIRKAARECLFNPDDWGEYYQGLSLYLLGALKFKNLDDSPQAPLPKQVAFWGAASAQRLLREGRTRPINASSFAYPSLPTFRPTDPSRHQPASLPPNPFTDTLALRDPARFVGRDAELRRVRLMLQGGSVALLGHPKIGKSSLLWHLAYLWAQSMGGEVLGPLDCHALEDRDDLYADLASALGLGTAPWRSIRRALNTRPALLLLDELDAGPERGLTHADLARLRAVCSANRSLKLMTASRSPLKTVFPDPGKGSPAYNFLQPLTLGPLTKAEARLLLTHPWAPDAPHFDTETCDQLLTLAEGHPFKLQRAAFHRYQALADLTYNWQEAYNGDLEQML